MCARVAAWLCASFSTNTTCPLGQAYFLVSVAETALDVIAGRLMATSGQQGGLSPAEATATLERFARVHAKCQRCAEALCPRFAVLAAAVWRLTSAANAIALRVLQQ